MNNPLEIQTEAPSLWRRIWTWFISLFNWTRTEEEVIEAHQQPITVQFEALEEFVLIKGATIADTKKNLLKILTRAGRQFQLNGETDGYAGVSPLAAKGMIKSYVRNVQHYLKALFEGEDEGLTTELKSKEKIVEQAQKEYEDERNYCNQLNEKYRWNFKYFSVALGLMYTVFSLLLILADIPLSIKVTQEVFLIENKYETYLMAIGIALCAFYIKVFYDEFLSNPLEKEVTQFKKHNLPGIDQDEEIPKVKRVWKLRFSIKLIFFLFSVFTITILAFTRFVFFINNPDFVGGLPEEDAAVFKDWTVMVGFICISVLFPLIGGVLASLGMDRLQNAASIRKASKRCKTKEKKYLEAIKEYSAVEKNKDSCDSYLQWCSDEGDFLNEYSEYFTTCYLYGHETGQLKRLEEEDVFLVAERMRKKMLFNNIHDLFTDRKNSPTPLLPTTPSHN